MPFTGPRQHFIKLLRSSASQVHDARCCKAPKTQDLGRSLWAYTGGGKGTKFVYLFNFEIRCPRDAIPFCVSIVVPLSSIAFLSLG